MTWREYNCLERIYLVYIYMEHTEEYRHNKKPCIHCQKKMEADWDNNYRYVGYESNMEVINNNFYKGRKHLGKILDKKSEFYGNYKSLRDVVIQMINKREEEIKEQFKEKGLKDDWKEIENELIISIWTLISFLSDKMQFKKFQEDYDYIKTLTEEQIITMKNVISGITINNQNIQDIKEMLERAIYKTLITKHGKKMGKTKKQINKEINYKYEEIGELEELQELEKYVNKKTLEREKENEGYDRVDSFKQQRELTEDDDMPSLTPITGGKKRKNRKSKKAKKSKKTKKAKKPN